MTNGNDLLEFEEDNMEFLIEKFLDKFSDDWHKFVEEEYNNK